LIGDSCEDEYIYGRCERISPEAPVPVIKFSKLETRAGMAANVYLNLQAFDIDITFLTNSEKLVKTRFVDEKFNHQILRVDNEEKIKPLMLPIVMDNFDAIVISDYNKGYLSESKLFEIVDHANATCPIFIDSKKTYLPNKETCFIKINEEEFGKLDANCYIENLIVTKGSEGCIYKDTLYPAEKVKVYDVVGAGDTFLAALVYGYLKYANIDRALMLANKASTIAVQQQGTYVLTKKDVSLLY
jgi:D-beta-D-heptose 7-phosphate kinase/D-beta-D-heptose 1-phosphate adenosyltransferase